jgi:hypothetical protein
VVGLWRSPRGSFVFVAAPHPVGGLAYYAQDFWLPALESLEAANSEAEGWGEEGNTQVHEETQTLRAEQLEQERLPLNPCAGNCREGSS